jgi:hypothetical protein
MFKVFKGDKVNKLMSIFLILLCVGCSGKSVIRNTYTIKVVPNNGVSFIFVQASPINQQNLVESAVPYIHSWTSLGPAPVSFWFRVESIGTKPVTDTYDLSGHYLPGSFVPAGVEKEYGEEPVTGIYSISVLRNGYPVTCTASPVSLYDAIDAIFSGSM